MALVVLAVQVVLAEVAEVRSIGGSGRRNNNGGVPQRHFRLCDSFRCISGQISLSFCDTAKVWLPGWRRYLFFK